MQYMGFYREMEIASDEYPSIHDAVGGLEVDDKQTLMDYLEGGRVIVVAAGWVGDVIDPTIDKASGSGFVTDGEWIWPIELSYYVRTYDVAVPKEFIQHARANGWQVPELTVDELTEVAAGFFESDGDTA